MKAIELEIEVVVNMIKLCKRCLVIHIRERKVELIKKCLQDIKTCEAELKRLLELQKTEAAREAALITAKEPVNDGAALQ